MRTGPVMAAVEGADQTEGDAEYNRDLLHLRPPLYCPFSDTHSPVCDSAD